ncbi:MAG: glycine/betaine ABC transporter substrate-binding protein [Actinobacteria bacterium]|nr:glycine/betaine ABC transporter substrate-binding protein [Actinomycetota bacterium]
MQMRKLATRQLGLVSMLAAAGLMVAACGGGVNSTESSAAPAAPASEAASAAASEAAPAAAECGDWGVAMHAWVGYTASAQVLTNVAESLGCNITQTTLDEAGVTYDAMEAGSVDVIVEDWGGGRWQEWVDRGAIKEVGSNGNVGLIGMFVPKWMADEYPDITDGANLNKYADLFKNSESGDKGAWYEGPPGYTTIGEKLISANDLNYKIISTGSEAALIELFSAAEKNKTAALGYFYEPQNFLAKVPLARVNFPANDWTDAEKASGLTDYPQTQLQKLATTKLMESGSPFATLLTNFSWTNEDQNMVALDIENGMTPEEAAQKWIDANKDKVDAWLAAG